MTGETKPILASQSIISVCDIVSPTAICASSMLSPSTMHMHLKQFTLTMAKGYRNGEKCHSIGPCSLEDRRL